VLSGLSATAKKVRYYSGPTSRPAPALTSIKLSGNKVVLNATNGFVGGTYYVLASTNIATPIAEWIPVLTNLLGSSGSFTLVTTNNTAGIAQQFYVLEVE
jgi:hypothetical protein